MSLWIIFAFYLVVCAGFEFWRRSTDPASEYTCVGKVVFFPVVVFNFMTDMAREQHGRV